MALACFFISNSTFCFSQVGTVIKPELVVQTGHNGFVTCIDFSQDGNYLVSGGVDRKIIVWDIDSKLQYRQLFGHTQSISCLKYSIIGKQIYAGSNDRTVSCWNVFDGGNIILPPYKYENNKYIDSINIMHNVFKL